MGKSRRSPRPSPGAKSANRRCDRRSNRWSAPPPRTPPPVARWRCGREACGTPADHPMWCGQSSGRYAPASARWTTGTGARWPLALTARVRLCRFCRLFRPPRHFREDKDFGKRFRRTSPAMDFSLVGMWKSMGLPARLVVITLAIMSVYSLSVMAERLFSFSRAKDQSRKYAEKLRDLLPGHQMIEAAQMATTMRYGHIPRVLGAGISEYNRGRDALRSAGPHDVGNFDLVEAMSVDIADASNELVDFFLKEGRFDEPLTSPGTKPGAATGAAAKA